MWQTLLQMPLLHLLWTAYNLGMYAKTGEEVDSHCSGATPLPESTFLRLT